MTIRWNRWAGVGLGVAAAVVAVAAGATAINAATTGTGHHLLSSDDVARQLAALPTVAASAEGLATPGPGAAAGDGSQVVRSDGGTVVVSCAGDTTTLLRWTPNSGFRADDDATRAPAHTVTVEFTSDTAEIHVAVTCQGGVATGSVVTDDRHGGNGGNGGPTTQPTEPGDDHGGNGGGGDNGGGDDHGGNGGGGGSDDGPGHH